MRIGDQQLRVRYPKNMNSLYHEEYERKRSMIGGKTEVLNRDKEKKFFKADQITSKTTNQIDFTGQMVPYERVKKTRPATSYGPFISSTSYGNTFQKWEVEGGRVGIMVPKPNLQSTTGVPFKAVSAYRDTFKGSFNGQGTGSQRGSMTGGDGLGGALGGGRGGANGSGRGGGGANGGGKGAKNPNDVFGGKNRAQKSQISILSSPGHNKTPFMKETTNRAEFKGTKPNERSRPIKHTDNLGNVDLKVDPRLYDTTYRGNFKNMGDSGV